MFTLEMAAAKANFFDTRPVQKAIDKAARQQLSKFGAFVRQRSRTSIRTAKKISRPGKPPAGHTGLLKKFIFFSYDAASKSVVIGPVRLNKPGTAPKSLEYGGAVVLVGKGGKRTLTTYKARPFMRPAFDAEVDKFPGMWSNCLR